MKRWFLISAAVAATLLLLAFLAVTVMVRSGWMAEQIRLKAIETVEHAAGGRMELARVHFDWRSMRARAEGIVLHGTEPPDKKPLLKVQSAEISLTVVSFFSRKVRLDRLVVEAPEFRVYVDENGEDNLPARPTKGPRKNPIENLLSASIGRLEVNRGIFEYDRQTWPVNIDADGVDVALDYDARGPHYHGTVKVREARAIPRMPAAFAGQVKLEGNRVIIEQADITRGQSVIHVRGTVTDWLHPAVDLTYQAEGVLADIPQSPLQEGRAKVEGTARLKPGEGWLLEGRVDASGLAYQQQGVRIAGVRMSGQYSLTADSLEVKPLNVKLLGGEWTGTAFLDDWRAFRLDGAVEEIQVDQLMRLGAAAPRLAWKGYVSGTNYIEGRIEHGSLRDVVARASVEIQPEAGAVPVSGFVETTWRQAQQRLEFNRSWIAAAESRAEFSGVLGERLDIDAVSLNIEHLEPVVALFRDDGKAEIPFRLIDGEARFKGRIMGPLNDLHITGDGSVLNAVVQDQNITRASGSITINPRHLTLRNAKATLPSAEISGNIELDLAEWKPRGDGRITAAGRVDPLRLQFLNPDLKGDLTAAITVSGTLDRPVATADVQARNLSYAGETIHAASGRLRYRDDPADALDGTLRLDEGTLALSGTYAHQRENWREGVLTLSLEGRGFELGQMEHVASLRPGIHGVAEFNHKLVVRIGRQDAQLTALDGKLMVRSFATAMGVWGDWQTDTWTQGETLRIQSHMDLRGRPVQAVAQVKLAPQYPVQGKLVMPATGFHTLRDLTAEAYTSEPPPVQGVVEGEVDVQGPLSEPSKLTARAVLSRLVVRPRDAQIGETAVDVTDLTLRNAGPVSFDVDRKGVHVRTAKFTARETDLALSGSYTPQERQSWNLRAEGRVNLALLSTFKPDLQASGTSVINATLRGTTEKPQLSGRMEVRGASLFLRDVPNGIEQANGVVLFENDRASIERLAGLTGGGTFEVRGFVGLAANLITYRLQATANRVRIRYPEGVSTTLDANLSLTGTSVRSLLSGNVSVLRSGFNPRTDLASIVVESARPAPPVGGQNEFLRGMLFDVRVRTAPNAELQTSYTRDVQTEADLRLRGSPAKPVVLGRVRVSQGEVDFLGTRYRINRGEISFYNASSLEPAIDLDLETRVRGITVLVNFAGTLNKLNMSYRSDPPLQTSDILALLAVGRAPDSSRVALGGTAAYGGATQGTEQGTSSALLGGALTASLSGRLERFFGAARIKLDPQMTSVDNTPQARLTVEQQVTRDATLTFVTNLNRTQQQIWRVEWDLSREWSVVAERNDNGLFGIDFQLRKGFK